MATVKDLWNRVKEVEEVLGAAPPGGALEACRQLSALIEPLLPRPTPPKKNRFFTSRGASAPSGVVSNEGAWKTPKETLKKRGRKPKSDSLETRSNSTINDSVASTTRSTNKRNKKGETPLHTACVKCDSAKVLELLASGVDPNTKDFAGWTPLHEVVCNKSPDNVNALLEYGAFPDVPGPGNNTPLHEAVRYQNVPIIRALLEYGADPNTRNSQGFTPFQLASDDIKSILNDTKPTKIKQFTPPVVSTSSNLKIYPSSLSKANKTKLDKLSMRHSNISLVAKLTGDVHFVLVEAVAGSSATVTHDTLSAVTLGVLLVGSAWIGRCSEDSLADVEPFRVDGVGNRPDCVAVARLNRLKMRPSLFDGCHFYFLGLNTTYEIGASLKINKQSLSKLVTDAGGVLLKREPNPEAIPEDERRVPFHAAVGSPLAECSHYIVYRSMPELAYNMVHVKALPVGWLIDCILNYSIVDP